MIGERQIGYTNSEGIFELDLNEGQYKLLLSSNAITLEEDILIDCTKKNRFDFVLTGETNQPITLKEVGVKALTAKQTIDLSPFSVQTIDLQNQYNRGGDVSEVLNRASGVKLRSDGNLGSSVQINLGGLQGKAVRLFKDGIPIELFGHGFSLGTIPVNMLERVEIYKGVMPLYLASDALGGGINLVSRSEHKKFAELSYEVGSFNTHRATAHLLWRDKSNKWYLGTNSSFNYSANDYKVNVPFHDLQTGVTEYKDARRFHDDARTHYAEGYAGVQGRSWVDDLRLTLISSSFYKQLQHDAEMNKVYGEAYSKERNYTALVNYKKHFLDNRLKVNVLGAHSAFNTRFIDTATVRYGWDGNIIGRNLQPGEINLGNNQQLDYNFFSSRINVSYDLSDRHSLDFSHLYYRQGRKGSDPLGAISAIERIDVLTVPSLYQKDNMALGLRSKWLGKEIESIVALKYYHFNTKGYTTDNFGLGWISSGSDQQLGYLAGLRWTRGAYLLKASYEYANRLPDEYEVFGDARLTKENMDLKPEKSHNINLNGQYTISEGGQSLNLSAGLFYRKVQDIIFLQLDIPFSRYINYERAEVKGFEFEVSYAPVQRFNLGTNLTYQDIRRVGIQEAMFRNLEGSRIPNVPFFFGNFWMNTNFTEIFSTGDRLELNWNGSYTHRFFLKAIPKNQEPGLFEKVKDIQTSLIIPRDGRLGQLANNVGLYYHFANRKLMLSGECRNIGDVQLYDNFNVQKPGRSFHIKLVYQFF
nr:TonB-dependent receptor plug domain-containing protein [Pedobacter panaciterrae]